MHLVTLVSLLAIAQYIFFAVLAGRARSKYGVQAPATTGHPVFERFYRVQMNTLELLVAYLPAQWLAAQYWSPQWMASLGLVYLGGRGLYALRYTRDPASRTLGFMLSLTPIVLLVTAALIGVLRAMLG
ncbi:MAPEG family protein [Roseateles oligotrophus]|uniref:MAPEG family protein n=1 Tax=Roseateles oligotrophus TaxID=1769250 RepID=A0ABT2YKH9_9BURK|nr:MAPEG family protein [Roseateles oligotrophus]MCV2370569.1 MAPEG family protein [Roseateles oligotrophus]